MKTKLEDIMLGVLWGGLIGTGLTLALSNIIPYNTKVEPGYVAPNDVKIRCENINKGNRLPETFQNIKGKSYLLKWDNGKPILQPYKVKAQEIVPIN